MISIADVYKEDGTAAISSWSQERVPEQALVGVHGHDVFIRVKAILAIVSRRAIKFYLADKIPGYHLVPFLKK